MKSIGIAGLGVAALFCLAAGCGGSSNHDHDEIGGQPEWHQNMTLTCMFAARQRGWTMFGPENIRALGNDRWEGEVVIAPPKSPSKKSRRRMLCEYDRRTGTAEIR
jgi:hypothetical protein